ncbi:hypothetical protein CmeUKMEL1_18080 [Cryptosporidium meleagridis]|uniref:Uncharacterized protein n=1 Tax=Cryptosporidium meleagridis TaxID=93969 RepID=A0A2P4Z690_9CRYT|nr:hypothetical protein CmeUKMEL1_18080 [Cryptosporidium meleagridis]
MPINKCFILFIAVLTINIVEYILCFEKLRITPNVIEDLQNGKITLTEALDRYIVPNDIIVAYVKALSEESQKRINVDLNGVTAEVFFVGDTYYIGGIPPKPENELTIYERLRDLSDPGNPGRRWCWKFVKHAQAPYNWGHITNFENCEFSGDDSRYQITEDSVCTDKGGIESTSIYQGSFTNYELACIERRTARLSSADSCWIVHKGVTQEMIDNAEVPLQRHIQNQKRIKISVKPHLILKRLFGAQANACNPENLVAPFKGLDGASLIASRFNRASGGIELLQRCDGSQYNEALVELESESYGDVVCVPDPPRPSWLCSGLSVYCKPY